MNTSEHLYGASLGGSEFWLTLHIINIINILIKI